MRKRHQPTPKRANASAENWTNDHQQWYRTVYLKSDHWKSLRSRKLLVSPRCERCPETRGLDVHHVNYRNIFDVESDLLTLCRDCHDKEHDQNGMPVRSRSPLRISQKQFPDPAISAIHAQNQPKLDKVRRHIESTFIARGRTVPNNLQKRVRDLERILSIA